MNHILKLLTLFCLLLIINPAETTTDNAVTIQNPAETATGTAITPLNPAETNSGGSLYADIETPAAIGLSQTKLELTTGFSKTLSVTSTSSLVTWSSDNKKIASVNSTGKVTAKSIGTCVITADCEEGTFTCNVTVKKNIYQENRITISHVDKGSACVQVYKAYYDNKGNLKVILAVANNNEHKIEALKKIKVTFQTPGDKKIATYTLKNKKLTVKKKQIKNVTFLIPKKSILIKNSDLRSAFSSVSGKYGYTKTIYFPRKNNLSITYQ